MNHNSGHQDHHILPVLSKAMLPLLTVLAVAACRDSDPAADEPAHRPVSLTFSVSGKGGATRMSSDVTQQSGNFRGIKEQYLYPFNHTDVSGSSQSLDRIETQLERYSDTQNYLNEEPVNIPEGTRVFLCYCKAGDTEETSKFKNGSTLFKGFLGSDNDTLKKINTADIAFLPEVIGASTLIEDNVTFQQYHTQTAKAKNAVGSFVYPAELFYYTSSPIKTSYMPQRENYYQKELGWDDLLKKYENETNGVMQGGVVSVAIEKPLNYAVGRLEIGLVIGSNPLTDASAPTRSITLSGNNGIFPLTGIFVTGQFEQDYALTPKGETEYIAYDNVINPAISMDAQVAFQGNTTTTNKTPQNYTQTLVLQSKNGANVRFALEFTNNSGAAFNSIYGTVEENEKFYLVGTIRSPGYDGIRDQTWRVFTKDFVTKGTATINSLSLAYPYLPDLFNPNLEASLELKTDWVQSTTTNVAL